MQFLFFLEMQSLSPVQPVSFDGIPLTIFFRQMPEGMLPADVLFWKQPLNIPNTQTVWRTDEAVHTIANYPNGHNLWLVGGRRVVTAPPAIPFYTCLVLSLLDTVLSYLSKALVQEYVDRMQHLSLMEACALGELEKGVRAKQN